LKDGVAKMIHWLELMIVIFGGVLGGIALIIFGWGLVLILMPTLSMALREKRERCLKNARSNF